ncbi:MAG: response regulator transcription factor [Patescibacteria group bacterium]|nr:response regulator transcription factor [Patescibacteria group bacterium]
MTKILIVEDDLDLADSLAQALRRKEYETECANTGEQASYFAEHNEYDLILLDINLPGKNGFELCSELRKRGDQTLIIMLTRRSDVKDRVTGLDSGADDYLPKPFSMFELEARIRSLLRRQSKHGMPIKNDYFVLNPQTREFCINNHCNRLSSKEFAIMKILTQQIGRVVPRSKILSCVWGEQKNELLSNTLEVHISRLRKMAGDKKFISSFTNAGYMLRPEVIKKTINA